jgi:hypothetical protein
MFVFKADLNAHPKYCLLSAAGIPTFAHLHCLCSRATQMLFGDVRQILRHIGLELL